MSISLALQRVAPDYKYRGSLTAENQKAFDDLITLSGIKPSWAVVSAEVQIVLAEIQATETEEVEWKQYKADKEAEEKEAWKLAGKPNYKDK